MRRVSEKQYLELMRDLAALRRSRETDGVERRVLERDIREHEEEVRRRDRHDR